MALYKTWLTLPASWPSSEITAHQRVSLWHVDLRATPSSRGQTRLEWFETTLRWILVFPQASIESTGHDISWSRFFFNPTIIALVITFHHTAASQCCRETSSDKHKSYSSENSSEAKSSPQRQQSGREGHRRCSDAHGINKLWIWESPQTHMNPSITAHRSPQNTCWQTPEPCN